MSSQESLIASHDDTLLLAGLQLIVLQVGQLHRVDGAPSLLADGGYC